MNKWDVEILKQKYQALERKLQWLLDRNEISAPLKPSNEIISEKWQQVRQQRNEAAAGWYDTKQKRPEGLGINSQLLPDADQAIHEAMRKLNIKSSLPANRKIETMNTELLNDISLLETRITAAIRITSPLPTPRVTDATPVIPPSLPNVPETAQSDRHEYWMQANCSLERHLEMAIMPFWESRTSGGRAIPERMSISYFNMQLALITNLFVEVEVTNETPSYLFFFRDFIIPVEVNNQPNNLIICIGKR